MATTEYIMGYSEHESQRLILQAKIVGPTTERFLRSAGLAPGMRVLDVGCGVGDVSMVAARIVGPSGSVLGLDRDGVSIQAARDRAAKAGLDIEFQEANLEDNAKLGTFDFAIGRYVLVHQPDPVAFIRSTASYVRSGGVVAFQELVMDGSLGMVGRAPLWYRVSEIALATLMSFIKHPDIAVRLSERFFEAGLPDPVVTCDVLVDSSPSSDFFAWTAGAIRSIMPYLEKTGRATADLDVNTLEQRLREEAATLHSQTMFPPQFSAWATKV